MATKKRHRHGRCLRHLQQTEAGNLSFFSLVAAPDSVFIPVLTNNFFDFLPSALIRSLGHPVKVHCSTELSSNLAPAPYSVVLADGGRPRSPCMCSSVGYAHRFARVGVHISLCVYLYERIVLKSVSGSPSVHIHAIFIRTHAHGHIHACIHENMYKFMCVYSRYMHSNVIHITYI
jgi:hypothetical protein